MRSRGGSNSPSRGGTDGKRRAPGNCGRRAWRGSHSHLLVPGAPLYARLYTRHRKARVCGCGFCHPARSGDHRTPAGSLGLRRVCDASGHQRADFGHAAQDRPGNRRRRSFQGIQRTSRRVSPLCSQSRHAGGMHRLRAAHVLCPVGALRTESASPWLTQRRDIGGVHRRGLRHHLLRHLRRAQLWLAVCPVLQLPHPACVPLRLRQRLHHRCKCRNLRRRHGHDGMRHAGAYLVVHGRGEP